MRNEVRRPTKLFTIQQANAMLPLVRAIVKDIVRLSHEVQERRARLTSLHNRRQEPRDLYSDELSQIEEELQKDTRRLREFAEELRQLGVELKSGPDGLVDFPSRQDGRVVYLCWKYDEPEILHWHELDGGFAGRQPLTSDSSAGHGSADDEFGADV